MRTGIDTPSIANVVRARGGEDTPPGVRASRFAEQWLLRCAFTFALIQLIVFYKYVVDDTFISFRYARNLVLGNGLVFNVGERVEGFSNFLWTVLLAGSNWLGVDMVVASKFWGLASIVAVIVLSYRLFRQLAEQDSLFASGVAALLASSFPIVFFGITGMETVFYSALLLGAAHLFLRQGGLTIPVALCLGAVALTRPEGLLYFLIAVGVDRRWSKGFHWRAVAAVLLFTMLYGAFLAWCHHYYDDWLPNTFYAKLPRNADNPVGSGLDELYHFVVTNGGPLFLALVLFAVVREWRKPGIALIAGFCVGGLVFQLYTGGDWMEACRFLTPILPFYVVLGLLGLRASLGSPAWQANASWRTYRPRIVVGVVLLLAAFNLIEGATFYVHRGWYPNFVMTSEDLIPAAQWIGAHYPSRYTITSWRIGALAYFSGLRVVDATYGLTDKVVAHQRFEHSWNDQTREEYFRQLNPELIIGGDRAGGVGKDTIVTGGREYRFVRQFPQGEAQQWYLYERADVAHQRADVPRQ